MSPDEVGDAIGITAASPAPDTAKAEPKPPATLFAPPDSEPAPVPSASPDDEKKAGPAPTPDWSKADYRRGKETDFPEEHRAEFRHRQEEWKAYQADNSRREADLVRREADAEAREKRVEEQTNRLEAIEERLSKAPATSEKKAGLEDAKEEVEDILSQRDLEPDVRDAVELVDRRIEMALKKLNLSDRLEKIDQALPTLDSLTKQQQEQAEDRARQDRGGFFKQIAEAGDLYGEDINIYTKEIAWRCGFEWSERAKTWVRFQPATINRATGEPHTVMSAYEHESGITARKTTTMRETDAKIKKDTKKAGDPGSSTSAPPISGELSESEARSEARALGFGRK